MNSTNTAYKALQVATGAMNTVSKIAISQVLGNTSIAAQNVRKQGSKYSTFAQFVRTNIAYEFCKPATVVTMYLRINNEQCLQYILGDGFKMYELNLVQRTEKIDKLFLENSNQSLAIAPKITALLLVKLYDDMQLYQTYHDLYSLQSNPDDVYKKTYNIALALSNWLRNVFDTLAKDDLRIILSDDASNVMRSIIQPLKAGGKSKQRRPAAQVGRTAPKPRRAS